MAAAADLYRATAARRWISIFHEASLPLSWKLRVLSRISDPCPYGVTWFKSVLGYCSTWSEWGTSDQCYSSPGSSYLKSGYCSTISEGETSGPASISGRASISGPASISGLASTRYRYQLSSHQNGGLKINRRTFSSSSGYWRAEYGSEQQIPWSQGIIEPSPMLVEAPIWQISFVSRIDCNNEDWMSIEEFCYTNPTSKLLCSGLVSSDLNIYILYCAWRHFIRVLGTIGSYNNSNGISTYPSFIQKNIKVSRRFLEPALIEPIGVRFDDPVFQAMLKRKQANGPAYTFHAIRDLILDIANQYFLNVVKPLDVHNLLELMSLNVIPEQTEMLIMNNPCLLPYSGRVHFTHYAHYLFLTKLATFRWPSEECTVCRDVLSAIGSMASADGSKSLEEVISTHPLLHKIFTHRGSGILTADEMRRAALMKGFAPDDIPMDQFEVIKRGSLFLGLQWNIIKHSLDPEVLADPKIIKLPDYSLKDVIDLVHGEIPLGLPIIGDMMLAHGRVPFLKLHRYFPAHVDAFRAIRPWK